MLFGTMQSDWSTDNMPMLNTWKILVTGGTSGIGFAAAREFLHKGAHVFLLSENMEEGTQAVQQLKSEVPDNPKVDFFHLDLTDLDAVTTFAKTFKDAGHSLHVLINNAGVSLPADGREEPRTPYGVEKQLAVNVYGPLLLTHLLLPVLEANTPSRIIFMASPSEAKGHIPEDLKGGLTPDTSFANYASTNVLRLALTRVFSEAMRSKGVSVYAVEPGQSNTPIFDKQSHLQPMGAAMGILRTLGGAQDPSKGALSTLYAATVAPDADSGSYYGPYYMSSGLSTNTGNTEKREALSEDLADPARCWQAYHRLLGVLHELGHPVSSPLQQSSVGAKQVAIDPVQAAVDTANAAS